MASNNPLHDSPPPIFRPRVRDGMIVVRRPPNRDDTAIFWTGDYFFVSGRNRTVHMDYSAFLADLEAHLQFDPELDEIQFHVPPPYPRNSMNAALPGENNVQHTQPVMGTVRTYHEWLTALAAMQISHMMRALNIEYVLRDGSVTTSANQSFPPVAAAQFFIVRTAGVEHPNEERNDNSAQA
ncbi:uncharacterized protein PGRI_052660 [Penicillium griseofulvum]|uniref:Uncharacterized protein n=1 Tax=Penicillium patulum TaxID=5078 RepID=A0A135LC03_PENPA|nr:uncharacterized protein PGRI_052660 [Penicillium griseofulvum]KXG46410.1 hypothetical protein PGRI_052660 [Penicillium griseofulvum]